MRFLILKLCLNLSLMTLAGQPHLTNNNAHILNTNEVWWVFGGSADWSLSGNPAGEWSFQRLMVPAQSTLHLPPGIAVCVRDMLDNQHGFQGIVLHADNDLRASLIHQGETVSATIHSPVAAVGDWHASPATDWRMISSPVSNQAIEEFIPGPPGGDYDFYLWSETEQLWINYKQAAQFEMHNQGLDFRLGHGYLIAYEQDQHFLFQGPIHAGDVICNGLGHSQGEQYGGWHLLGNPFASALKWNHDAWERQGIYDEVHVWDPPSGNYISNNQGVGDFDGIIRSQQAMFIKVAAGTKDQSLNIPTEARVHSVDNEHRNRKELPPNTMRLAFKSANLPYKDAIFIRILPDAKTSYDPRYDAHKLFGSPKAPLLHSQKGGRALSIHGLKPPETREDVLLWFHPGSDGEYQVTFQGTENMDNTYHIYFTDLYKKIVTDLQEDNTYHFQHECNAPLQRFMLTFSTGDDEPSSSGGEAMTDHVQMYAYQDKLYIHLPGNDYGQARLMDTQGRLVKVLDLPGPGKHAFRLALAHGPYLVELITNNARYTQKVMLGAP